MTPPTMYKTPRHKKRGVTLKFPLIQFLNNLIILIIAKSIGKSACLIAFCESSGFIQKEDRVQSLRLFPDGEIDWMKTLNLTSGFDTWNKARQLSRRQDYLEVIDPNHRYRRRIWLLDDISEHKVYRLGRFETQTRGVIHERYGLVD
jgi:hypothetical protein